MSQQINLINPSLIIKQSAVTPNGIALGLGLFVFGLIGLYSFENNHLMSMQTQKIETMRQLSDMEKALAQLTANKPNQDALGGLEAKIQQLETKKMQQQLIIDAVNQNSIQSGKSYAALLRAFSKQSVDGLWITGLKIDQEAQHLSIKGRTLNADLVPEYIARLRAEPALSGKTFTELNMVKVVHKKEPQAAAKPAQANGAATVNPANQPLSATIHKPDYIEFTLQSIPDTSKPAKIAQTTQQLAGATH